MVFFSPATKEITAKIVYYGPGMCGKTTNLQKVHELMAEQMRSDLVSVATETDRTIYFDFLPLKLGKIAGFDFVVRTYTVPGQPYYAETRKMVLQGADGVVFVADSQRYMLDQNKDSLNDLKRNLKSNGLDYRTIPMVIQFNKRDLPDCLSPQDLNQALNERNVPVFQAAAVRGTGVVETLKGITLSVFKHVRDGGLKNMAPSASTAGMPRAQPQAQRQPQQAQRQPQQAQRQPQQAHHAATSAANLPRPGQAPRTPAPVPMAQPPQTGAGAQGSVASSVAAIAQAATPGEAPIPSKEDIGYQEFQNLAVLHHKLQERVAQLEKELKRLGQDHADLKRLVGKRLL